ncbi:hypothetical protein EX30DRAFT_343864 [Ascodesmis nigricans]|uniref:Secreted protein n=1 Tax=Ascodesmis nigricans TaxID=341454 RepID=A0A4S2MLL8_9PEZI|nr:hypothetical protein EX30DRAFT_343864 [Ascodesmis nigricans]
MKLDSLNIVLLLVLQSSDQIRSPPITIDSLSFLYSSLSYHPPPTILYEYYTVFSCTLMCCATSHPPASRPVPFDSHPPQDSPVSPDSSRS